MELKLKGIILLVLLALICSTAENGYALKVTPGRFDHFALQVPEQVTAGEELTIKALAQDAYNNLITNFSEAGRTFKVSVSLSATVHPANLTPASFQGGVATLTITARKAEKLLVYIHEVDSATPVLVKEIVIAPDRPVPASELAYAPASKSTPARALAEKVQGPAKKIRKTQKTAAVSPPSVKEKDKDRLKPSRAAVNTPADVKKPLKAQTTVLPQPLKETRGEEPKKTDSLQPAKIFTITDISVMEAGGKGLLVISGTPSSGAAAYKHRHVIEHKLDREWLKLSLAPAVRKIAGEVMLKSEMIGEILLEEDRKEKDTVNIYIELKTNKPFYDILEQKNALIVMFSKIKF